MIDHCGHFSHMAAKYKRPYRDFSQEFGFKHILISFCNKTAVERQAELHTKVIEESCEDKRQRLVAFSSLLHELIALSCMSFQEAFEEYIGKIPSLACKTDKHDIRSQFKDKILSKNGLPVLYLENNGSSFVMLQDRPLDKITLCQSLDQVLDARRESGEDGIPNVFSSIPAIMELLSTAKDRAILTFVLSSIFSATKLSLALGMQHQRTQNIKQKVDEFLDQMDEIHNQADGEAKKRVEALISRLQLEIARDSDNLNLKRTRLHEEEIEERSFEIELKRRRLDGMEGKSKSSAEKRLSKRLIKKWKNSLMSQKGKGLGRYKIDRGAEQAIYEVLQEQLKAHNRRWGEEGTGYLEHDKRLHSKEMRRIANAYLTKRGKKPIRSKETVRSWGKCRNRRSRQAKQHRGRNLWAHLRPQKKWKEGHINIHYNRAHIKNYTRFAFSNSNKERQPYVIRRAIDDKAYVRCGTSEGFSRPLHSPVQLSSEESRINLPSSDYPDPVGYVAPGVVLLVNEMKETEHKGCDKFVPTNVTVNVTCKPKHIYSSSATNWANDLISTRYNFRSEHEVCDENYSKTCSFQDIEIFLIGLRDSVFQFQLMTIKEDYERVPEGGDHLARERMRVQVLLERLKIISASLEPYEKDERLQKVSNQVSSLNETLRKIGEIIFLLACFLP